MTGKAGMHRPRCPTLRFVPVDPLPTPGSFSGASTSVEGMEVARSYSCWSTPFPSHRLRELEARRDLRDHHALQMGKLRPTEVCYLGPGRPSSSSLPFVKLGSTLPKTQLISSLAVPDPDLMPHRLSVSICEMGFTVPALLASPGFWRMQWTAGPR